jgi:uncharacterized protein YeaO (DUF488 family)
MTKSPTNNKMPEFSQAHNGRRRGEMTRQPLRVKRVYQAPDAEDGVRVLVDRLWPRGLSRERAQIDLWLKEIAPSDALRRCFQSAGRGLLDRLSREPVTLLFAAREEIRNNAVALKEWLENQIG